MAKAKTKVCYDCGEEKRISQYHRHPTNKDGRQPRCKDCERERGRRRYEIAKAKGIDPDATFTCSHCHEAKPASAFWKGGKTIVQSYCKDCRARIERVRYVGQTAEEKKAKVRAYYHANKARIRARRKELDKANPEIRKAIQERYDAKRKAQRDAKKAAQNETNVS